jgi:hypothetical protein
VAKVPKVLETVEDYKCRKQIGQILEDLAKIDKK